MTAAEQLSFPLPVAGLTPVSLAWANTLLARWGHYLGPVSRPFGAQAWVLDVTGEPAAVAVSCSTVSEHVPYLDSLPVWSLTGKGRIGEQVGVLTFRVILRRGELVELARLCSAPDARWATRPMLRLWREVAAPRWPYWPVTAAQAIRTHSKGLLFVQLQRDAAAMWQAWADYLVVFRAPGKNDKPIPSELTQNEWIEYARPVWYGIRETDVLGTHEARENDDERHLCPLQLPVIERAVRLWSGRGETVLSPFAGIGSEGVGALRHGRRFVGVELKPSYFRVAVRNLKRTEAGNAQAGLFDGLEAS